MKNSVFYVVKKSAGYAINMTSDEAKARQCAKRCCEVNFNNDYIVAVRKEGMLCEI